MILYATGLGATSPIQTTGTHAEAAADVVGAVPVIVTEGAAVSSSVSTFGAVGRGLAIDSQLESVYNAYLSLNPLPIQNLTPAQARLQPTPADAVMALLSSEGESTAPVAVGSTVDTMVPERLE